MITTDGNNAVASVAYRTSEIIAIYPITPSSAMAEQSSAWSSERGKNLWGDVPRVVEMQSEGGAIAAVHGALQTGALATSFTSSQGLLLMIPNLYKLAGQLIPFVLHVAARTVATHALSIFGDHSDVMAVRQTGCAMLCASNVQEAQDFALISQIASLNSRLPFIHFFDGFRTSHEIAKIAPLADDTLRALLPADAIRAHRDRALTPDKPVIRGTAANPDTYFQCREASNPWYDAAYGHVSEAMQAFGKQTGRNYRPFEYVGHPQAERIVVLMGSAIGTCEEVIERLLAQGEKVGLVKVRLFRPFSAGHLLAAIPESARTVAVLDRTKEPGAQAEPLYLDVMTALAEAVSRGERASLPRVIGGRYGLSSKEFGPACALAVFAELAQENPRPRFTVGIFDDITGLSLPLAALNSQSPIHSQQHKLEALFYGLGSDGTVSAAKNSIKILGNHTDLYPQGYFVYDSKKAGGIFLLNTPYSEAEIWQRLPSEVQHALREKEARFYIINAARIARDCQLGNRINTVMQMAFFQLSAIIPPTEATSLLKQAIATSYGSKGQTLVERNWMAPGRSVPPAGRSATSPRRSPSGKRSSVPSATTASPPVPTRPFAPRW